MGAIQSPSNRAAKMMSIRLFLVAVLCLSMAAGYYDAYDDDYASEEVGADGGDVGDEVQQLGDPEDIGPDAPQVTAPPQLPAEPVKELSIDEKIRRIVEHFKQDDPLGIPGVPIPDPKEIPDIEKDITGAKVILTDAKMHDMSKFRIDYVRTDLKDLKVWISITFPRLRMLGRYGMSSWLTTSTGDFNITLIDVNAQGFCGLTVDPEGILQATNISLDMGFGDIKMQFDNLGFLANLLQGAVNSLGSFIFNSVKPVILGNVDSIIKGQVNSQMRSLNYQFPDSVPPLDAALATVRSQIREKNMDPFRLPDMIRTLDNGVTLQLYNGTFKGLASIHRSGDIQVGFENNSLAVGVQMATQRLFAEFNWQMDTKLFSPQGKFNLQIDTLDIKIAMKQSANVQKKPRLEVAQLKLGNVQARSSGAGTMDYVIEFAVNLAFNSFRGIILRAIEKPVTSIIQTELDKIDIESIVEGKLAELAAREDSKNEIDSL